MSTGSAAGYPAEGTSSDLRTRRRLRTRRALQQAALYLFAERGYDETTVADIAERAEVGVRTFFVHFPSKEDVLINGFSDGFPELFDLIVTAPAALPDLDALEFALLGIHEVTAPDRELHHQMTTLLVRAAGGSSVIRGLRLANGDKIAIVVADALARRRGEDPPSLATVTLAEAAMRMFHLSVDEWAGAAPDDIIPIFLRRFQALREVAADPSRIAPPD